MTGGKVVLSEGGFNIVAVVNVPSAMILAGQGYATRLDRATAGDVLNAIGTSGDHLANIVIEHMRITGPSVSGTQVAGVGIDLDYNDRTTICHCWVSGFGSGGDDAAVRLRHAVASKVIDNYLSASKNGLVTGLSGSGDFPEADRCAICGNFAYDNFDDGLHSQQSARLIYNNNICYGNGEAGIDLLGDDGDTLSGNECYNNGEAGIEVGNSTGVGSPDTGHSIGVNVCKGNTTYGILIANNAEDCTLSGNTCNGNSKKGINLAGASGKLVRRIGVTGNTANNNGEGGIWLQNNVSKCLVAVNQVHNNSGRGIYVVDAGSGSPVDNTVKDNLTSGNATADVAQSGSTRTTFGQPYALVGPFVRGNLAANLTNSKLGIAIVGIGNDGIGVNMAFPGSIVGISVSKNTGVAWSAGTATFTVYESGVGSVGLSVEVSSDVPDAQTVQAVGLDTFVAGQRFDVRVTTDGDWAPTTMEWIAYIWVRFD